MKKLFSTACSFITSAAILMSGGIIPAYAGENELSDVVIEEELTLGELDDLSLTLPSSVSVLANYNDDAYNYGYFLDANNAEVYKAMMELIVPSTDSITITLPEPFSLDVSALPGSVGATDEDNEAFRTAIFSSCKPGIDCALYDIPEICWLDQSQMVINVSKSTKGKTNRTTGKFTLTVSAISITPVMYDSLSSVNEAAEYCKDLEEAVNSVDITGDTLYEQLKSIHDHISYFTYYDAEADFASSAIGALVEPGVVCEGYAKAFKLCCDRIGVPCIVVFGNLNAEAQTGHAWNYVKMDDGNWYAVDVTWDDVDETDKVVKYDYFLKGSKSFNTNHTPESDFYITHFIYPELAEDNYDPANVSKTTTTSTTTTTTTSSTTTTSTTSSKTTTSSSTSTTTSTSSTTSTTSTSTTTTSTTSTTTSTSTTTTSETTTTSTTTTSATTTTTSTTSTTSTTTTTTVPVYLNGDLNHDNAVNVADLVYCANTVIGRIKPDYSCDADADGITDIFDVVYMRRLITSLIK